MPTQILDDLRQLAAAGRVEVVWATSWPLDMIEWALDAVGYGDLRFRHLEPTGLMHKADSVIADVEADRLPFVWVDDHRFPKEADWTPPVPHHRLMPSPQVGITPTQWQQIIEWLSAHTGNAI